MATADKLAILKATKADLKAALTEQGQTPGDVFSKYPDMVRAIQTGVTPSISVSSDGLITATAGDKSATKQLNTQSGRVMMPSVSEQLAVETGVYTTGPIYVQGDASLLPENIKSGVSIFGVNGTASGGNRRISDHISTGITIQDNYTLVIQHEQISPNTLVALFVRAYWSTLRTDEVIGACVFVGKNEYGPYGNTLLSIMGNKTNYVDYSFVSVWPILEEGKITIRLDGEGYAGSFNSSARYAFQFLYET